ncbi:MAG: DNA polymerase III subunit epsilon [Holosporales bacterium]|nr:DNA polymerase III subunit epsilon [Holosporales bacterium]
MREVVLDTETTGLSVVEGDRVVEIGCVELWNKIPTGKTFQAYINPERDVPEEATKITGLTSEFLKQFPTFPNIADDFLSFIQSSKLVIHNAKFDLQFINFELKNIGKPTIPFDRAIDTLTLAREKFPGQNATLDALAKRFDVRIPREKHGALLDSTILAEVYLALSGGRQRSLEIGDGDKADRRCDDAGVDWRMEGGTADAQDAEAHGVERNEKLQALYQTANNSFPRRKFEPSAEELSLFDEALKKIKDAIWKRE